jgi:DNA-directed RNA polymerase subunit H (RpoH/RPB5)
VAGTEGFLKNVRKYNPLPSSEKDRPKKEDIFQEERLRIGPEYKVLAGVSIYSEDGKEGRILKSLGIDKWDMSSKSAIPTIRNFENKLIREHLPMVVELAKEREAEHKKIYAESKDILSSGGGGLDFFGYPVGISEKVYVKKAMKRDIMKMVEKMRLSDAGLAILDSTQKIRYVKSMLDYRRLPSDKKEEAFQRFVIEKERTPFNYSEDFLNSQVPAFRKLPEKEQKEIINELKLKDIGELGIIGKRLPD